MSCCSAIAVLRQLCSLLLHVEHTAAGHTTRHSAQGARELLLGDELRCASRVVHGLLHHVGQAAQVAVHLGQRLPVRDDSPHLQQVTQLQQEQLRDLSACGLGTVWDTVQTSISRWPGCFFW